jgi:hypothetical protein
MNTIEVDQSTFCVVEFPALLTTGGLGPCVGVAIAWGTIAGVLHSPDPDIEEEHVTRPFFQQLTALIPSHVREKITPIVCGAAVECYYGDERDHAINEATLHNREFISAECIRNGFLAPIERWNADHGIQSVEVDLYRGSILIETAGFPDERFVIMQ